MDEVTFASKKILLLNEYSDAGVASPFQDIAMTDGSASALAISKIRRGYLFGDGPEMVPIHGTDNPPGQHTLGGARGRDVE